MHLARTVFIVSFHCLYVTLSASQTSFSNSTTNEGFSSYGAPTNVSVNTPPAITSSQTFFTFNITDSTTTVEVAAGNVTLTSTNSIFVISNFKPSATMTTTAIEVTTTAATTTFNPFCIDKEKWDNGVYELEVKNGCEEKESCTSSLLTTLDLYIECNSFEKPEEPQFISGTVNDFLLSRAEYLSPELSLGMNVKRKSKTYTRKHFKTEHGLIKKSFLSAAEPILFSFDDDNNIVKFPATELEVELTNFVYSVFKDVYKVTNIPQFDDIVSPLKEAISKLDKTVLTGTDVSHKLNSDIVSLKMDQKKSQRDFVEITLKLHDRFQTQNHKCMVIVDRLGSGKWQNDMCHIHKNDNKAVICRCRQLTGNYVILSEIAAPPVPERVLVRDSLTTVFLAICCTAIFLCLVSLVFPFMMKCSHPGGMLRVYRYADITFMLYYAVFLYGVYYSEEINKSKVVAGVLHFLHHAVMMWMLAEGIHLYHGMNSLYSDVTGMIYFYSTIVFGVSAAVAGSGAGYNFEFVGYSQYVWAFANGIDIIYIIIPSIVIFLIMIAINCLLIYELTSWIGNKSDYLYERAGKYIPRSLVYTLLCTCTNVTGAMSMQKEGSGSMSYFFMAFIGLQVICMLYFHIISNYEVWKWREEQEEGFIIFDESDENNNEERENKKDKDDTMAPSQQSTVLQSSMSQEEEFVNPAALSSQTILVHSSDKEKENVLQTPFQNSTKSSNSTQEKSNVDIPIDQPHRNMDRPESQTSKYISDGSQTSLIRK